MLPEAPALARKMKAAICVAIGAASTYARRDIGPSEVDPEIRTGG